MKAWGSHTRTLQEVTIAIANGSGPLLGGVLAQKVSWRWAFWLNLIICPFSILLIVFFLPLKAVRGGIRECARHPLRDFN